MKKLLMERTVEFRKMKGFEKDLPYASIPYDMSIPVEDFAGIELLFDAFDRESNKEGQDAYWDTESSFVIVINNDRWKEICFEDRPIISKFKLVECK